MFGYPFMHFGYPNKPELYFWIPIYIFVDTHLYIFLDTHLHIFGYPFIYFWIPVYIFLDTHYEYISWFSVEK